MPDQKPLPSACVCTLLHTQQKGKKKATKQLPSFFFPILPGKFSFYIIVVKEFGGGEGGIAITYSIKIYKPLLYLFNFLGTARVTDSDAPPNNPPQAKTGGANGNGGKLSNSIFDVHPAPTTVATCKAKTSCHGPAKE